MSRTLSLTKFLKDKDAFASVEEGKRRDALEKQLKDLQQKLFRIQQGIWHKKSRAIIAMEGFDAAGKGGAIRMMTEMLDPRGARVHPIGAPEPGEQEKHWLSRFWARLPAPGTIAIFDRTWYGRVMVERVDKLTPKERWKQAFDEINAFEKLLVDDGIMLVKVFMAVTKDEQLRRFDDRLRDPYKQWKITEADVHARKKWDDYVEAVDDLLKKTHTKRAPWNLVAGNDKLVGRSGALLAVTEGFADCEKWILRESKKTGERNAAELIKALGLKRRDL